MDTKDLFSLKGRTALITGGSRGIGRMIAEGFLAQGARVYISSRKAQVCDETAAELSREGGTCLSLPMDVSTLDGVRRLAEVYATREPALVAYNLDRWATRAQIARVLNDVFKPAIDECVRAAASE